MRHEELLVPIRNILDESGFDRSEAPGSSFGLVARKGSTLLIIRALSDRDSMDRSNATDLKKLASVLAASPILVCAELTEGKYRDGVLYLKFGIPLLTVRTLHDHLVAGIPPMVFLGPNGHYVSVDGEEMRRRREAIGLSLGALAEAVGVSRRAIQMYEAGMGVDLEVALRIEKVLDTGLIQPLDPFSYSEKLKCIREMFGTIDGLKRDVFQHLDSLGLEIIPTVACPFDALARDRGSVFMTRVEPDPRALQQRGSILSELSRVTGERSVMIVQDGVHKLNVGRTAVIKVSELKRTADADKLIKLIDEREG
jgi:putative transcriptional regulator